MSYWLEDAQGEWLGDFATNRGVLDLQWVPALKEFLERGEADEELVAKIVEACQDRADLRYIADMLRDAEAPVYVTDGVGGEEGEEAGKAAAAPARKGEHAYASTQVDLPPAVAEVLLAWARANLREEDLAPEGLELRPHVTVRYGLEPFTTAEEVARALAGARPARLRLGPLAVFEQGERDVLHAEVEEEGLRDLRDRLAALPHVDTQPAWVPHATLAYVLPGGADLLAGERPFAGLAPVEVDRVLFMPADGSDPVPVSLLPGKIAKGEWNEADHPRDDDGKFTESSSGEGAGSQDDDLAGWKPTSSGRERTRGLHIPEDDRQDWIDSDGSFLSYDQRAALPQKIIKHSDLRSSQGTEEEIGEPTVDERQVRALIKKDPQEILAMRPAIFGIRMGPRRVVLIDGHHRVEALWRKGYNSFPIHVYDEYSEADSKSWNEEDHPRDDDGKFTESGSGGESGDGDGEGSEGEVDVPALRERLISWAAENVPAPVRKRASALIKGWIEEGGIQEEGTPPSRAVAALTAAVRAEFAGEGSAPERDRAVVRALHAASQIDLEGTKSLTLYRGIAVEAKLRRGQQVAVDKAPVSSWTSVQALADEFAQYALDEGKRGVVLEVKVRPKQVVATPRVLEAFAGVRDRSWDEQEHLLVGKGLPRARVASVVSGR